jgi:TfoX/Sxy family transcriptional regulator of competence genes
VDAKDRQSALVDSVRMLLGGEPSLREVSMFGGRSFMVHNKMVASALKDGALLARVDAARHDELVARDGAAQACMGAGREMGPGWIEVHPGVIDTDEKLASWLDVALEYNRTVAEGLT